MYKKKYYIERLSVETYSVHTREKKIIQTKKYTKDDLDQFIEQSENPHLKHQYTYYENPRNTFAGLSIKNPIIMGILNRTPDSFSDGGTHMDINSAIAHAHIMMEQGASIIDIGGESSRPQANDVPAKEQLNRTMPIIEALKGKATISIDTRSSLVMKEALDRGVQIINDISALTDDSQSLKIIAPYNPYIILMHKSAAPATMMQHTQYNHVALDVYDYLEERINACINEGIPKENIAIDVGIGFGKTKAQNHVLHRMASMFLGLGCPLVWASSRKAFLGDGITKPNQRDSASIASMLYGISKGARIVRMHNVSDAHQAINAWQAIENASNENEMKEI